MNKIGIYVHIPFCESKCIYCDFASSVCSKNVQEKYFESLIEEIKKCRYRRKVKSIYFGGGTPSSVDVNFIKKIYDTICEKFEIDVDAEVTIECNPNSATLDKLNEYKKMGFNRISFGVQSLHDDILKIIGRRHNSKQALQAIENARRVGFKNISADLLIGLPNQSIEDLIQDAAQLINSKVVHISAYMLQVERNTPLELKIKNREITLPTEDKTVEMYLSLVDFLVNKGYNHYEISNFCRDGCYSRHNLNYWKLGEYLGFGLAAHSYINYKRIANSCNMHDFLNRKNIFIEKIDSKKHIEEMIMLGLRCNLGVDIIRLSKAGYFIKNNAYYKEFLKQGILLERENRFYLNPNYYGVSNKIICDLLP